MLATLKREPLLCILRQLSVRELGALSSVCRQLKQSVYNSDIWNELVPVNIPHLSNINKLGIGPIDNRFRFRIFHKHSKMYAASRTVFAADSYNLLEFVKAPWELYSMLGDWEKLSLELDQFESMPTTQLDTETYSPFSFAIMGGQDNLVLELCKYYDLTLGPEMADISNLTTLAAIYGRLETLRRFHESKVDLNLPEGSRPIVLASRFNHLDVVKQIVAWGYDILAPDANRFTVLHSLALNGQDELFWELCKSLQLDITAINRLTDYAVESPAIHAARGGRKELFKKLYVFDRDHHKALRAIVQMNNNLEFLEWFITEYDVDITDPKQSLIHIAAENDNWEVYLKYSRGRKITDKNSSGFTVAHCATVNPDEVFVQKLVELHGNAILALQTQDGETLMHCANFHENIKLIDWLSEQSNLASSSPTKLC